MELCVLIPAKDEEDIIESTIENLQTKLSLQLESFNLLVINDHSEDNTEEILYRLSQKYTNFNYLNNELDTGVGSAIRFGLSKFKGDVISICMADASDSPKDIIKSFKLICDNDYDCVFGSRFIREGKVLNYPLKKLLLNRCFNIGVKLISGFNYNDFTNIFKTYHARVIKKISPLESSKFSIGLEMSLKAFRERLRIKIIPICWSQRSAGDSKLNILKNTHSYLRILNKNLKRYILQKMVFLTLLTSYCMLSYNYSSKQGFWHDEFYTLSFLNGTSIYDFEGSIWDKEKKPVKSYDLKIHQEKDLFIPNFSKQILHEGHPPLYFLALKAWSLITGKSELGLRSFSIFCGLISLIILYKAFKFHSSRYFVPLLGITLVFFNPFLFYFFNEARMYALVFMLGTLCLKYWLGFMRHQYIKSKDFVLFTLASTCLLYTHYYGVFLILFFVIFEILQNGIKKSILIYPLPFLFFSPWILVIFEQLQFHNIHWTDGAIPFNESMIGYLKGLFNLLISPINQPSSIEYIVLAVLISFSIILLFLKQYKFMSKLFFSILFFGILIIIFDHIFDHHTILIPRYYILILIPISWGAFILFENVHFSYSLLITIVYIITSSSVLFKINTLERSPKQMIREVAAYLDQNINPEKSIVIIEPNGPVFYGVAHYLKNNFVLQDSRYTDSLSTSNPIYIDERLGVDFRENKYHTQKQKNLELIPFVGVFLYK